MNDDQGQLGSAPLEEHFDVVVVGSGAAGLTAALKAALEGLSVVVIEKTQYYGGATAVSGGVAWIPKNMYMEKLNTNWYLPKVGLADTEEKGCAYLDSAVGDRIPKVRRDAYVREGHRMIRELHDRANVRWRYVPWPDYYSELLGGNPYGRGIESEVINAKLLKKERENLRPTVPSFSLPVPATCKEALGLSWGLAGFRGIFCAFSIATRTIKALLTGAKMITCGQALVAQLRLALMEHNVPLWLSASVVDLITEETSDGGKPRVSGVRVNRNGQSVNVYGKYGVVFATGSFARSQEMRERYLPKPTSDRWTLVPEDGDGQVGDGINLGLKVGAALDLTDKCWGFPCFMAPMKNQEELIPRFAFFERFKPGSTVVNGAGKRYFNDSMTYEDMVNTMYAMDSEDAVTVPSWVVFDQRAKNKYAFFEIPPRIPFPKSWLEGGHILKAQTIAELAGLMGVPADNLQATIERYNGFSKAGCDEDFHKGETALSRFLGDPSAKHTSLGALEVAPFYAAQLVPSNLSTKGGLLVNEHSQVLHEDDSVIEGFFATGNCSASVMGSIYPGPGGTIGPAMVSGWLAAKFMVAASQKTLQVETVTTTSETV